jgi:hypothetical protein
MIFEVSCCPLSFISLGVQLLVFFFLQTIVRYSEVVKLC